MARHMRSTGHAFRESLQDYGDNVGGRAHRARLALVEQTARSKALAAHQARDLARSLRSGAAHLPFHRRDAGHDFGHDLSRMAHRTGDFARRNPLLLIAGGIALAVIVAKLLQRSNERRARLGEPGSGRPRDELHPRTPMPEDEVRVAEPHLRGQR